MGSMSPGIVCGVVMLNVPPHDDSGPFWGISWRDVFSCLASVSLLAQYTLHTDGSMLQTVG